jgi:hypothetical protein
VGLVKFSLGCNDSSEQPTRRVQPERLGDYAISQLEPWQVVPNAHAPYEDGIDFATGFTDSGG